MQNKPYASFSTTDDHTGFDHVIIGSGMGAMTLGTWLAKAGKKVALFEQHYVPGGFTHSFKRKDGMKWDVGVHYMGNMQEGHGLRKLMDFLTNHELDWAYMGEVYDVVMIGKDRYEIPAGEENFRQQMKHYFPDDHQAIDDYLTLLKKTNKWGSAFFFEKSFEPFLSQTLGRLIRRAYAKYYRTTTLETLQTLTTNRRLIAVLCGQCGNYGLPPKESSFAAHAMVIGHFMEGGYYPHGGSEQIANRTLDTFRRLGGKTYINAPVSEIVTEKGKVTGIRIKGKFIPCRSVISNIGIKNTFGKLLDETARKRQAMSPNDTKPSSAHLCLYVGLDRSDEQLKLPKHNIWSYETEDYSADINSITEHNTANKFSYVSFPSAKDALWAEQHPNRSTIQAISVGRYEWYESYAEQPWRNRETAYQQKKEHFKNTMLEKLYELVPQIKGHVIYAEVSTPLSTRHFTDYQTGEIYGLAHTPKRFALPYLRPQTKIKGLKLVGQDITLVGVAGAMLSGMLCAIVILKFRVWKIFKDMNNPVG
ncbi:phytoene desaturase family protein [Reichenbachiella agariperforans]|uniref:phytoene desaturase family protein n=1 Tax=Reichenbachiella agariperforans TaxID=156994 RepID=UPI001C088981|nr:NAD(P)/FAD-dependent oxidoreductase [Reichenbachiella agariperforans]MBU2914886.1 NAD(P)/FAD-dependent oxidoreductase [Reichenbachiella agariperforans]